MGLAASWTWATSADYSVVAVIEEGALQSAQGRQSSMFKSSMFKVRDRLNVEPGTLNHDFLLPWGSVFDRPHA